MSVPSPSKAVSTSIHQASIWEKLDLIPGLLSVLGTFVYSTLTAPFRGESGAYTFGQHVGHATLRKAVQRLSTSQLQYVGEPFSNVYEKWCKSKGIQPEFVTLKSGIKAFWMGDHTKAKYIVVYYHGGGFSLDGDDTHIKFWNTVQTDLKSSNIDVAFLYLEYTLVPYGTYPTQLTQAVEAVNYVITELKRPASDIILAGDSAGGNMCLGVLSQIMHPLSDLPLIELSEGQKLKALVLVAPWAAFKLDYPSAESNKHKDVVSQYAGKKWSTNYLAGKETSYYAEAGLAPAEWWKDSKVEQLLAVAGEDELLVDAIKEWAAKYKSVNPDSTTVLIAPREGHIQPLINYAIGIKTESEQGKTIKSWMKAKL